MKFQDTVKHPLQFPTPFPDCLYRVLFRWYFAVKLAVN